MKPSIIQKHFERNMLWLFFLLIIFVLGIWAGKAWATPKQPTYLKQSYEQYVRARPATTTTTTTTTTTVAPVKRRVQTQPTAVKPIITPQGDWVNQCHQWATQAGIPENDIPIALMIFQRESGCQPEAVNSSSGATGVCQSLPASKMATAGSDYLTNPITQMRWCHSYAISRYSSWANAKAFWDKNHWW